MPIAKVNWTHLQVFQIDGQFADLPVLIRPRLFVVRWPTSTG